MNASFFEGEPTSSEFPELIFGLAGPIGVEMDFLQEELRDALRSVNYRSTTIHITKLIENISTKVKPPEEKDFASIVQYKIRHANAVCKLANDPAILARVAMGEITKWRKAIFEKDNDQKVVRKRKKKKKPYPECEKTAYIIRQLKRPEEVELLRRIYGKRFILISAYGRLTERRERLETKIRRKVSASQPDTVVAQLAGNLMEIDAEEPNDRFGQGLRDAFHQADVFVEGINRDKMSSAVGRFIELMFGKLDISPTRQEYGMYIAKSAALRSLDLSRQVGAAIFSEQGDVIALGCNEVPKAFGGTYWDGDNEDYRDVKIGHDANEDYKISIVTEIIDILNDSKIIKKGKTEDIGVRGLVDELISKNKSDNFPRHAGVLSQSSVLDLTEYGRTVHAEMCAICDAARNGKKVNGSILFTTTFPCHNCTKHIIVSGIKKVFYVEPYPKSKAKMLHDHEIEIEQESTEAKVSFIPFMGVAPLRYRDFFEKGKRKRGGTALRWASVRPKPLGISEGVTYLYRELGALNNIVARRNIS